MMLKEFHGLPENFMKLLPEKLCEALGGPSLIYLEGRREPPLLVSVLLHGNEVTGFLAVQSLLKKYEDRELPRSMMLFVGNVEAARHARRRLDHQPDYNRIWGDCRGAEGDMARLVLRRISQRGVFMSVDVHNNTGVNPHYSCVTRLDRHTIGLAAMFNRKIIYFSDSLPTLSDALGGECPALTLECGLPGREYGVEHAADFLDGCLHMADFQSHDVSEHDVELYHSVAQVRPCHGASFGFGADDVDMRFRSDLDHLNFREVEPGEHIASLKNGATALTLAAIDDAGRDVGPDYFTVEDGQIMFSRRVMPAMLTLNAEVIRQDCLCYLLERIHYMPERD